MKDSIKLNSEVAMDIVKFRDGKLLLQANTGGGVMMCGTIDDRFYLKGETFSAEPSFWNAKLGACERKIYQYLWDRPNETIGREDLGAETGYSASSGGFNNALSRLNSIGLIRRASGG